MQVDYLTTCEVFHLPSPFEAGGQDASLHKPKMTAWENIYVAVYALGTLGII
jgi:hypothetical protein